MWGLQSLYVYNKIPDQQTKGTHTDKYPLHLYSKYRYTSNNNRNTHIHAFIYIYICQIVIKYFWGHMLPNIHTSTFKILSQHFKFWQDLAKD